MKTRTYPKLLFLAIFPALFVFLFSQKAIVMENQAIKQQQLNQEVKPWRSQLVPDPWTRLKSQFIWNSAGKNAALNTGDAGC